MNRDLAFATRKKQANTISPPLPTGEGRGEGSFPKRPRARFTPGLFLVAWSVFALPPVAMADRPSPQELNSNVDQYMAARVERDHFNGTVLVARNGQVLFYRGYGMANLEHDIPCTSSTKFRLGSITKQFTAMAILILQERGKLAVTDKVKKYRFYVKGADATLEFTRNSKGAVTHLTLLQDNRYSRALRTEPAASPAKAEQNKPAPALQSAGKPASRPGAKP